MDANINYETKSIKSDMTYNPSAIGDMNMDELDQLKYKNEDRINEIKSKYFDRKDEILNAKEIIN